jgi:hypothetical protein
MGCAAATHRSRDLWDQCTKQSVHANHNPLGVSCVPRSIYVPYADYLLRANAIVNNTALWELAYILFDD